MSKPKGTSFEEMTLEEKLERIREFVREWDKSRLKEILDKEILDKKEEKS